jgi:hypothetical protein
VDRSDFTIIDGWLVAGKFAILSPLILNNGIKSVWKNEPDETTSDICSNDVADLEV